MAKSFILIEADEDFKETVKDAIRRHSAVSAVYTVVPALSYGLLQFPYHFVILLVGRLFQYYDYGSVGLKGVENGC